MSKGPFLFTEFTPTKFSISADRAELGNHVLLFIETEWAQEIFTEGYYQCLSMCFWHIAHCDRRTFYETWFTRERPVCARPTVERVQSAFGPAAAHGE